MARVRVAEDGRIFVTRQNDSGSYIAVAKDAATLIANDKFTSILGEGTLDASTYAYNDANGNFIAGPNLGFDIKGSGENFKIAAVSAQSALWSYSYKGSRVDIYNLGNASTLPTPTPVEALAKTTTSPQTTNVEFDDRGGFWYCQYRTSPTDINLALAYVDATGAIKLAEGAGGKIRGGGGVRLSPDGTQIAISSSKTTFSIYDITFADDNTPSLTEVYTITHGIGTNCYDIAWDLAGNIYICGNSGEHLKGFSIPRADNDFTTKAAAQYAICYTAPIVIDPLYAAGAFQGWDPANAAEFTYENGVYVLDLEVDDTEREFKISTAKGDWDAFNAGVLGIAEGETWTTQYLTKDAPATLYAGGKDNIGLPWAGTWTITVDLTANTIVATTETPEPTPSYPENIYAIGNVGGYSWSTSEGIALAHEGDGVYKAQVSVDDSGNGNGYFQFATTLGDSWDVVNSGTRFGALSADETIVIDAVTSMTNNWGGGTQSWMIAAGEYVMVVDIVNCTVTVSNIADGIESIESENIAAPAVYYNLQGVEVENPAEGNIYVKVVNGKATKVVK